MSDADDTQPPAPVRDPAFVFLTSSMAQPPLVKLLGLIRRNRKDPVLDIANLAEMADQIIAGLTGVMVVYLSSEADLKDCAVFLKSIHATSKQYPVRIIIVSRVDNKKLNSALIAWGANEYLHDKAAGATMYFKTSQLFTQVQKQISGDASENRTFKSDKMGGEGRTNSRVAVKVSAEIIAEDVWLVKGSVPKKIGVQWVVESEGPDPDSGDWEFLGTSEGHQEQWVWKPCGEDGKTIPAADGDGWNFTGNKPTYSEESKKWRFVGSQADLTHKQGGVKTGSKIQTDSETGIQLAADNPTAEERIAHSRKIGQIVKVKKQEAAAKALALEAEAKEQARLANSLASTESPENKKNSNSFDKSEEEDRSDQARLKKEKRQRDVDLENRDSAELASTEDLRKNRKTKEAEDEAFGNARGAKNQKDAHDDDLPPEADQGVEGSDNNRLRRSPNEKSVEAESSLTRSVNRPDAEEPKHGEADARATEAEDRDGFISESAERDELDRPLKNSAEKKMEEGNGPLSSKKKNSIEIGQTGIGRRSKNSADRGDVRSGNDSDNEIESPAMASSSSSKESSAQALAANGGNKHNSDARRGGIGSNVKEEPRTSANPQVEGSRLKTDSKSGPSESSLDRSKNSNSQRELENSNRKSKSSPAEADQSLSDWKDDKRRKSPSFVESELTEEEAKQLKIYLFKKTTGQRRDTGEKDGLARIASSEFDGIEGVWEAVGDRGWLFMTAAMRNQNRDRLLDRRDIAFLEKSPGCGEPFYDGKTKTWLFERSQLPSKAARFADLPKEYQDYLNRKADDPDDLEIAIDDIASRLEIEDERTQKTYESFSDIGSDDDTAEKGARNGHPESSASGHKTSENNTPGKKGPSHLGFFLKLSDMIGKNKPRSEIYDSITKYIGDTLKADHVFLLQAPVETLADQANGFVPKVVNIAASTNSSMVVGSVYDLSLTRFSDAMGKTEDKVTYLSETKAVWIYPIVQKTPAALILGALLVQFSQENTNLVTSNRHFLEQLSKQLSRMLAPKPVTNAKKSAA